MIVFSATSHTITTVLSSWPLPKSKILQKWLWIPLTQLLAQLVAKQVVGDAWLEKVAVDKADVGVDPSKEGGEGRTPLTP